MSLRVRKERSFTKKKSIFCIEGSWNDDLRKKISVERALSFIEEIERIKTIRSDCHNADTLRQLIQEVLLKKYQSFGIIYLAFHGKPGELLLGKKNNSVNLAQIAEFIDGEAEGKIIHFGSCSTLDISKKEIVGFLHKTNALAVSGYKKDIDFLESAFFDLLYFRYCQDYFEVSSIFRDLKKYHSGMLRKLGFVMHKWQ